MEKVNIELIKIFGPSILKVNIPKPIIDNLNNYIDKIILDKKKSKELDIGERLVGDVTQEFELEKKIMQESGWGQFLSNCVSKWIELETKNEPYSKKEYWPFIEYSMDVEIIDNTNKRHFNNFWKISQLKKKFFYYMEH